MPQCLQDELFGILSDGSHALLALHRTDNRVLAANSSFRALLGLDTPTLVGADSRSLFVAHNALRNPADGIADHAGLHEELRLRVDDDYPVFVSMNVAHVQHAERGPVAACIVSDITERRLLERELLVKHSALQSAHADLTNLVAELRQTQADLERRNQEIAVLGSELARAARRAALGEFSAGIAHSVNNPLSALASTVKQIEKRVTAHGCVALTERLDRLFKRSHVAVKRMEEIVGSVRNAHRSGQLDQPSTTLDIGQEMSLALSLFDMRQAQINVRMEHPSDAVALAPSDAFHHVMSNLVENAVNFMPDGGDLHIHSHTRGDFLVMNVHDTGPGVPETLRDRIFEPFVTGHSDGTGLGLAISERLARQWGGRLRLLASDVGAHFELTLPRKD